MDIRGGHSPFALCAYVFRVFFINTAKWRHSVGRRRPNLAYLARYASAFYHSALTDKSPPHRTDGECYQTISHPAISVWSVSTTPNGDIVTGASDGIIRIFSEAEERLAPPQELKAFDDLVASQALPSQQVGDVKKSDLPGLEALDTPGTYSSRLTQLSFISF
jgi:phospholipase A-2-activating protein